MKIETLKKVLTYLEAYEKDLKYNFHSFDVDQLNNVTNGTNEFKNKQEAIKYFKDLFNTMKALKNEIKSAQTIEIKEDLNLLVKNNALTKAGERYQCYVDNTHEKYIKTFDEWMNS